MKYQECKAAIILLLILPRILLQYSSQDSGLIGLIENILPDARLLRSHAEEPGRGEGAEHCRDAHQMLIGAAVTVLISTKSWQQMASVPSGRTVRGALCRPDRSPHLHPAALPFQSLPPHSSFRHRKGCFFQIGEMVTTLGGKLCQSACCCSKRKSVFRV